MVVKRINSKGARVERMKQIQAIISGFVRLNCPHSPLQIKTVRPVLVLFFFALRKIKDPICHAGDFAFGDFGTSLFNALASISHSGCMPFYNAARFVWAWDEALGFICYIFCVLASV